MIKYDGNKLEIYSKTNTDRLKLCMVLFATVILFSSILLIYLFTYDYTLFINYIILAFLILSIVLEVKCINLVKKPPEEKLFLTLDKNSLELYKKDSTEKYEMDKIINFSCDTSSYLNEVFLNYYNDSNKKVSKLIYLRGCENTKFVDIANKIKNNLVVLEPLDKDSSTISTNYKSNNDLRSYILAGNELKVCFIGKSKLLVKSGNTYKLESPYSNLLFCDEFGNLVHFKFFELAADITKLIPNSLFILKYNKKKDLVCFTPITEAFDTSIVTNIKNKPEFINTYLFEYEDIKTEYNIERKLHINKNIFLYSVLIGSIFILIYPPLTLVFILFIFIYVPINILGLKKKCIK